MSGLDLGTVLCFRPGLRVESLDDGVVFLLGERKRVVLSDLRVAELASVIDGKRTVRDVMLASAPRVPEVEALYVLEHLVAAGHLVSEGDEVHGPSAAFWCDLEIDARVGEAILAQTELSVRALGDPSLGHGMTEALERAGLRVRKEATISLVVTDDYLHADLAVINADALSKKTPWFLVRAIGTQPLVGPFFHPGRGPCWECLAFWMRGNRPVEALMRRMKGHEGPFAPPVAALEASMRAVFGLAALAVVGALASLRAGKATALQSQVVSLDAASLRTTPHTIVRRPQCPACGNPREVQSIGERPLRLESVGTTYCADGGYRRQTPRQTHERLRHLVSPLTGPVTHVVPVPGRDTELRAVYASGYMVCPSEGVPHRNVFDKVCAGKGRSAEQAKVSALCEALERWSGVHQGDEARVRASWSELRASALHPRELLKFSETQYNKPRPPKGARVEFRDWIAEPLTDAAPIDWSPAWSLSRNERRYVPLTYCYSEAPSESGTPFCRPCGNGVAAGNCLEEAILQGLLELVERDAIAVWWYNRIRRPQIALESFHDAYFNALEADYARLGWKVWVLDLTHDLRIPVCAALAHQSVGDRFAIGFGAHLEPRLAVQRALTELNQLFDPSGTGRAPWAAEGLKDRAYLFPTADLPATRFDELPCVASSDLRADIEQCQRRVEEVGLELIVVDKTRPEIGLNVVQAIVPGLRPLWPRFAPGRLYDVPYELGWVPRTLTESELNPVPLFV
jgi:bacteriocin biosynthesis cyclodehydratase domain-containing protein